MITNLWFRFTFWLLTTKLLWERPGDHVWCVCILPVTYQEMKPFLLEEWHEFLRNPSRDEASDIVFCLARIVGGYFGQLWLKCPGIGRHVRMMHQRMHKWGCVRSENHPHCNYAMFAPADERARIQMGIDRFAAFKKYMLSVPVSSLLYYYSAPLTMGELLEVLAGEPEDFPVWYRDLISFNSHS